MEYLNRAKQWVMGNKKLALIYGTIFLALAIATYAYVGRNGSAIIITVEKGAVEEEVLVTGKTRAESEVDLGFERSGKVSSVNVAIGSSVQIGDRLVTLEQNDVLADLNKAQANLNQALIELSSTAQTSPLSFQSTYESHASTIRDAFVKADDAVRNGVDSFFQNPRTYNTKFDPTITDGNNVYYSGISESTRSNITDERIAIEQLLINWQKSQVNLGEGENLDGAFNLAQSNLNKVGLFLDHLASAINSMQSTNFTYDTTIQGYKDKVNTAREKINTALSNLLTSKDKFDNAPTKIDANFDDTLIEEAKVASYRADVSNKEAELAKTIIASPISGVVTKLEVDKGEIVSPGATVVSVISDKDMKVEANVSEVNIGKVAVGNKTKMSFDAFPGETYSGEVYYIDPGETIVDGIPTYKISVSFKDPIVAKIRSGLTVNLKIVTQTKEDVVKVPIYGVEKKGGESFVTVVKTDGTNETRKVTLGLLGKDGNVEIVSGLQIGEKIVVNP